MGTSALLFYYREWCNLGQGARVSEQVHGIFLIFRMKLLLLLYMLVVRVKGIDVCEVL